MNYGITLFNQKMKKIVLIFYILLLSINLQAEELKYGKFYSDGLPTKKWVTLTFDDGPNPFVHDKIFEILKKEKIKATFFILGSNMARFPNSANKYIQYGQEIGNHTYSHLSFYNLRKKKTKNEFKKILIDEIDRTEEMIKDITDVKPLFLRMPNGFNSPVVEEVAKERKYIIVNWSFGFDWKKMSKDQLVEKYLNKIKPGAIILMHEKKLTAEALPEIITGIKKKGYEIVPLKEILSIKNTD